MPNPEVQQLIADNLGQLPNVEDAQTPLVFPLHVANFAGSTEEFQQHIVPMNRVIAAGIVELLEQHGKTVVNTNQLGNPMMLGEDQLISVHCSICGGTLIKTTMRPDGMLSIPPRGINPDCEQRHGAAQ